MTTAMYAEGWAVMPQTLVEEMGLDATTRVAIRFEGDVVIMKVIPAVGSESALNEFFKRMDEKNIQMSEEDVVKEIRKYRKEKREQQMVDKCIA